MLPLEGLGERPDKGVVDMASRHCRLLDTGRRDDDLAAAPWIKVCSCAGPINSRWTGASCSAFSRWSSMHIRSLSAAGFLCLGVVVFSLQDVILKGLSGIYPVTQAMTVRSLVALPILLMLVRAGGSLKGLSSPRWRLLATRAVISLGAYLFYYLSLAALPMADAVALFFVAPLIIAGLGILFLGEQPNRSTVMALLLGLVGVVITLRPGAAVFEWAALLTLLAAALYALAQILARKLGDSEGAAVMTSYQNAAFLLGAPALAVLTGLGGLDHAGHPSVAFLARPWVWPSLQDALLMAACGAIAAAGMTLLSQAYRLAPAGNMAVFEYSAIIWAPLWGFLFFAEVPKATTFMGAVLICGAGILALRTSTPAVASKPSQPAGEPEMTSISLRPDG